MSTAEDVICLVSCAVNGKIPEEERVTSMNLDAVYALASYHMLTAAAAAALESLGVKDSRFSIASARAMRKTVIFDNAWEKIRQKLESAGIWYMPLKGAVLKNMYPKYGMREFGDYDILFDASRADDVKTIMEGLGFKAKHFGAGNHDCYHKAPCLNFEMHRMLFGPGHEEKLYAYYKNVDERLIRGEGLERHFTPEDFYLYFLSHEYKHYKGGGTGLRSLLDTFVYLSHVSLNEAYVAEEAEKLGIREFEEKNRSLSLHLFSGENLTGTDQEMLEYILSSGAYGTIQHRVENALQKNGWSKIRYALNRFAVPISRKDRAYTAYAGFYPFFYRHRMLLPFLPFYRIFRAMKAGRFKAEARALRKADK